MKQQKSHSEIHGALPVYMQITELISRQISAGHLSDGERLPPERLMAKSYNVSVGTLRKSLASLTQLGLLERRQGSGNYIKKNENSASLYSFFRLEKLGGGGLPSAHLLSVDTILKPDDLPAFGHADFGHRFRRLRFLDNQLAALEEIWLDGSVAPNIDPAYISHSLYKFYKDRLGLWIIRAEDWVSLAPLPLWGGYQFQIPAKTMLGFVERYGWSQDENKIEYSRTWFDPKIARYVARLR